MSNNNPVINHRAPDLEPLAKLYGVDKIVDETQRATMSDLAFLELDLIRTKDMGIPRRIYAVVGDGPLKEDKDFKSWQVAHNGFLAAYRAADFSCAAQELLSARKASSQKFETYYTLFADRLAAFFKNPPAEDWDGVFDFETK